MKTSPFIVLLLINSAFWVCNAQNPKLKLIITGQDNTENKIIDSIAYTNNFKNFSKLNNEINSFQEKIIKLGYLDATLKNFQKTSDSIVVANFSLNTLYKELKIRYDKTIFPTSALSKIPFIIIEESYFTIPFQKTEQTLQYLTNYLVNKGNTFSSIRLSNFIKKDSILISQLISTKSNKRTIDKIIIKGYSKFPKSYIKYYSKLKIGKKFTKKELLKKSQDIENLIFTKNTKSPEILFNKDSTSIYLYLVKESANTFDGFLGFSNNTESNKLTLNGYINLQLINNLNFGEKLSILYKNDGSEQQRFQGNIYLPYIFKSPIGIEAGINIFKKDSSFIVTKQKTNLTYLLSNTKSMTLGYNTSSSSNLLNTPSPILQIEDFESSFFSIGFKQTKLQNKKLFPIKNNISLLTEFGSRKTNSESVKQTKVEALFSYSINLNDRNSIFIKNTTRAILSDNLLTNELFRFGGINSIRGFEENSLNASIYNITNSEYRIILSSDLYIHSIIDYAYYKDNSINTSKNLTGIGLGIGLKTQSGLFKIILANGKESTQNFNFSNTKVHVSLYSKF